jgi:pimeloyl-ACP methyl ester carboxylesterase
MSLPVRNARIKLSQGQLFWREVGQEGPTLLFLHGSWHDSSQWVPILERLGDRYHCFALDLLGIGESERPDIHYSITLEAEAIEEFLEALNEPRVFLVGHSLGAWVAATYALKYPDRACGLLLLSPEGVEVESLRNRWRRERSRLNLLRFADRLLQTLLPLAKLLRGDRRVSRWRRHLQQLQDPFAASQLLFYRREAEIQAELLQDRLSWLKIPLTLLHGDDDRPEAIALCKTYASLVPHAELHAIADGGDNLPERLPDLVAQRIRHGVETLEER